MTLRSVRRTYLPLAVVAAVALLAPQVLGRWQLNIAIVLLMFVVLGQAWNFIGGYGKALSLGHAAFFAIGAYSTGILQATYDIPTVFGLLVGVAAACALAVLVGYATFRLTGAYFAIATIAIVSLIQLAILTFRGVTGGAAGLRLPFRGEDVLYLSFRGEEPYYYLFLAFAALSLYVTHRFERSALGFRVRATGQDEVAARSLGINTRAVKLQALLISATMTALAGGIYAPWIFVLDPRYVASVDLSILIAAIPVVGGLATPWGPVLGAVVLTPIEEYLRVLLPAEYAGAQLMAYGLVLLLIVRYRPDGLWGLLTQARARISATRGSGHTERPETQVASAASGGGAPSSPSGHDAPRPQEEKP